MIMTARALRRGAGEGGHGSVHHVVPVDVAPHLPVDGVFPDILERAFIPRPGGDESERGNSCAVLRVQDIRCQLISDKPGIRLVRIKGGNKIVTIGPGIFADGILVVPVGVRVVGHIQPMARPALAVAGAGQQGLDDFGKGLRRSIEGKGGLLLRSRGQASQIKINPAQ